MHFKNRTLKIIVRLIFWITYFYAGYKLYFGAKNIPLILINFSKLVYPLTIFWLQIRINNRENWIPVNSTMTTSQLWFKIIPVLASLSAFLLTLLNLFLI